MNPHSSNGKAHLLLVTKAAFLQAHREGLPFEEPWTQDIERAVAEHSDLLRRCGCVSSFAFVPFEAAWSQI
jgi:hypothetical protein